MYRQLECLIVLDMGEAGEVDCHVRYYYTPADSGGGDYPASDESFELYSAELELHDRYNNVPVNIDAELFNISDETILEKVRVEHES